MSRPYVRKKFFLVLMLLFFFLIQAPAQEKPMITVLPFSSIEVPAYVSQIITQLFETHLVNTKAYDVLSQNERDQILSAQSESLAGCTDESCAIEIGRLLAAEQVILGTVAALGTKYIINAKIIDVTTSKTLGADMISAASVEDLDNACRTLTYSLVEKALPEGTIAEMEPEPEPAPSPEPAAEAEVAEEPEAEPETEPEEPPKPKAPKPKPVREPGAINWTAYITHTAGVVCQTGGSIASLVAFTSRLNSLEAWDDYMAADESSAAALYREYQHSLGPYTPSTIASYTDWGAGAAAYSGAWFIGNGLSLSGTGKIAFAAGKVLEVGSSLAGFISGNQAITARNLWNEYMAAETGVDDRYEAYTSVHDQYEITRGIGLGYLAAAGTLLAVSPFLPGEKYVVAPGFLNRLLLGFGSVFVSAGNVFSSAALNARVAAEEAFGDYMASDGGELYDRYLSEYYACRGNSILAFSLWAAGGVATLVSLFVPFGGGDAVASSPIGFSIQPVPTGFGAEFHITLQ